MFNSNLSISGLYIGTIYPSISLSCTTITYGECKWRPSGGNHCRGKIRPQILQSQCQEIRPCTSTYSPVHCALHCGPPWQTRSNKTTRSGAVFLISDRTRIYLSSDDPDNDYHHDPSYLLADSRRPTRERLGMSGKVAIATLLRYCVITHEQWKGENVNNSEDNGIEEACLIDEQTFEKSVSVAGRHRHDLQVAESPTCRFFLCVSASFSRRRGASPRASSN